MGSRFPAVTAKQVIRVLNQLGFRLTRQAGTSHAVYRRDSDNRRTIVPIHPGQILKRKTLKAVLHDIALSIEEFRKYL
ncbi:MAG: type II toxin-antitoxin system HicA family toxin [Elusimicrobia bacterium]|nr:type II toxin-antitoxin system HicA family toxin [Elusimicrobiota bacterium]